MEGRGVVDPEGLSIIYQDEHLVAVNKPAGLKVHRGWRDARRGPFLVPILRDQLGRLVYPVHRLDRPTSGVLLLGLSSEAARRMAAVFAAQGVAKTYLAVVRGHIPAEGAVDHPLRRDAVDQSRHPDTQAARTLFRRLACAELPVAVSRYPSSRYSLAQVHPLTGRMHQIRRHLRHIAHPVIGDTLYGDGRHNRFFREALGVPRLLLAATAMEFAHPWTGAVVPLAAPLDEAFAEALGHLGWLADVPPEWLPAPRRLPAAPPA